MLRLKLLLFKTEQQLETLHAEGGQLTRLNNVSSLRKLRRLNVHMNRLTDIDLSGLDSLESVDLSYNQLDNLGNGWIGNGGGTEDMQVTSLTRLCLRMALFDTNRSRE